MVGIYQQKSASDRRNRPELPEFPALEGSLCATLLVHKAARSMDTMLYMDSIDHYMSIIIDTLLHNMDLIDPIVDDTGMYPLVIKHGWKIHVYR